MIDEVLIGWAVVAFAIATAGQAYMLYRRALGDTYHAEERGVVILAAAFWPVVIACAAIGLAMWGIFDRLPSWIAGKVLARRQARKEIGSAQAPAGPYRTLPERCDACGRVKP